MVQGVEKLRRGSKSGSEERRRGKAVDSAIRKAQEKDGVKLKVGPAMKGGRGRRQTVHRRRGRSGGSTSEKVEVVGSVLCAGSTKQAGQAVRCGT